MQELTFKQKLTNYYYFVIFNSLISVLISISYWLNFSGTVSYFILPDVNNWVAIVYIVTKHIIIFTLFSSIAGILILPTIYLQGKKRIFWQSTFMSFIILLLFADIGLFYSYGLHFFNFDLTCFKQISTNFIFTTKKIIAYCGFICFVVSAFFINNYINRSKFFTCYKITNKYITLVLISVLINSIIYLSSSEKEKQLLSLYTQRLQFFLKNKSTEQWLCYINKKIRNSELKYPLQPLKHIKVTDTPNILIIAMDAWRADCFNEQDSPNLWQLAHKGKIFNNHFSGGNHTCSGLFSLFYSIPAIYFNRFCQKKIPALFFERLKHLNYQINIATYDQNIKNFIKTNQQLYFVNEKTEASKIDQQITDSWIQNYNSLDKTKPWFSFVFYNSLHDFYFPENYSAKIKSEYGGYKEIANKYGKDNFILYYKASVHYIDNLANQILTQLKQSHDLENTIVIITADHGCEWDDNNQGKYGYRSNFTNCQIKVPLVIVYPKIDSFNRASTENKLTMHYDIIPTLMQNFLGVTNNIKDYSIGINLINSCPKRDFALITSIGRNAIYNAIVEQNKQLVISPNGIYNFIDSLNQVLLNKTINNKHLNQAIECMTSFIKK